MILDDEPNIVEGLYLLLSDAFGDEAELYTACLPAAALDIMKNHPMDLLILDICMPGINGIEMLDRIERERPRCKVILLTGYSQLDYMQSAVRHTCCVGYVLKTQGDEVLLNEIRQQLEKLDQNTDTLLRQAAETLHSESESSGGLQEPDARFSSGLAPCRMASP